MLRDSGTTSGYFRDGELIADRYGRHVQAVRDPEDGSIVYITETGRILAKDPAPQVDARPWWVRAGERFLIATGLGFWLLVMALGFASVAHGQDVPAWVIRGIAAVETGVHWSDTGDIRGTWSSNDTGDVGPWHISLAVLRDLKLSDHADRLQRDPVYAESITRLWLLRLYAATGDWFQVCAAWRAGLKGRHRAMARDYAERARNYGTTY
jgi:hypothetical protein